MRVSDHYRRLADNLQPEPVSAEIAAMADEFDSEAARIRRVCAGKRVCPCKFSGSSLSLGGDDSLAGTVNMNQAALAPDSNMPRPVQDFARLTIRRIKSATMSGAVIGSM